MQTEATRTRRRNRTSPSLQAGDRLGRFSVLSELGAGGMGRIYEAYDPNLDRRIALKLVHDAGDEEHRQRLVREAQALARLDHPNVVTVHEVGVHDESLFVAMELLRAGTLKQWIAENPVGSRPRLDDALSLLIDAAQGLMAVHDAGLVHRDVKPSNILLGENGRAKIADFGIARSVTRQSSSAALETVRDVSVLESRSDLTRTGASIGTPAYMAPEQHGKGPVDASADLFAFCITAWETIFGERPFRGSNADELLSDIRRGRVRQPSHTQLDPSTEATLRQGLSYRPSKRPSSMSLVIDALRLSLASTGAPQPRRRRTTPILLGTVGAVALASTAALLSRTEADTPAATCVDAARAIEQDWTSHHRSSVRSGVRRSGAANAEQTGATVERMLDDYVATWGHAADALCRAKLVDSKASAMLDQQAACLDDSQRAFSEVVDVLSTPEVDVAPQAVQVVVSLPPVEACSDPRRLRGFSNPRAPEAKDALGSARAKLARARAYGGVGDHDRAIGLAREAMELGRKYGSPSIEAAGLLVLGRHQERKGLAQEAERSLRASVKAAEVAHDHATRALALIQLVYLVGRDAQRNDEARALGADARTVLRMLGSAPLLQADLDVHLGAADRVARNLDDALRHYESALKTYTDVYGPTHPQTGRALTSLGGLHITREEPDQAIEVLLRAKACFEASLGTEHPNVPVVLSNLGIAYKARGRLDLAIATLQDAVERRRKTDGDRHPGVARTLFNLGSAQYEAQRYDDAIGSLREGRSILEDAASTSDVRVARYDLLVGTAQVNLGRFDDAAATLEPLLDVFPVERGDAGRFARRTRLYLAIATLPTDLERARTLIQLAGDTTTSDDGEHALFEHLDWLVGSVEYVANG